ncbi:MAG: ribonuclease T [Legionellales bacterium]|nr:ribonuclease T [Legionellales bacterium]
MLTSTPAIKNRFRGYLPVIIDIESGGFNAKKDALLEIAAVTIIMDEQGILKLDTTVHFHINPFEGANLESSALLFNKIDPYHPFRFAVPEKQAITELFKLIRKKTQEADCQRAILTGHNPAFDLAFLNAAVERCAIKRNPFHSFSCLDTATLSALAVGQTVLAKAVKSVNLPFDPEQAHSALYDATQTAELFCAIVNKWQELEGWSSKTETSVFEK